MAETLSPSGILIPKQTENISAGGVEEMRLLGSTANTALAGKASTSYVDAEVRSAFWPRGILASGSDWDTVKGAGLYIISALNSYVNTSPGYVTASNGVLIVESNSTGWATQRYIQHGASPISEWRTTVTSAWNPWRTVQSVEDGFVQPASRSPLDLDTLKTPQTLSLNAPFPEGYAGVPVGIAGPSLLMVVGSPGNQWAAQMLFQYGAPRMWWRTSRTFSTWNEWEEVGAGGDYETAPPPSDSHGMRVQAFKDAYPLVSTGGKGVVTLRFDHGLTNFKSTIWPLLQQYNVKAYIAMNSRNWGILENSGATFADAKAWIASGLVEFGNHTADHADRNTDAGIYDNIVNGRLELEDQLGTIIHGFTVPGLSEYDKMYGFASGSLDTYSSTYAGGLILANHGIVSGVANGVHRPLDGVVRQGQNHYGWEWRTAEDTKSLIDQAVSRKTALTLMAHPRYLGMTGYFDAAIAEEIIAYIRAQIDAGNLADLSFYQSHHAQLDPVSSDTDWIDVIPSGPAVDPAEPGVVQFRRVGDQVFCRVVGVAILAGSSNAWLLPNGIPAGYRLGGVGQVADVPGGYGNGALQPNRAVRHRLSVQEDDIGYVGYIHNWDGVTVEAARADGSRRIYGTIPPWITDDPFPA